MAAVVVVVVVLHTTVWTTNTRLCDTAMGRCRRVILSALLRLWS
jgi:hypothetical protein